MIALMDEIETDEEEIDSLLSLSISSSSVSI